jgi:hypothetical protein
MIASVLGRTASAVRLLFLAALGALAIGMAAAQQPAFTPREEAPEEFPDAPGREETFYTCSACHAFKLVAQQGMSRQRWDGTLDLMVNLHGMAKLEGKDREAVLDYLERAFPERAPATGGWQNPFLKQ